MCGNQARKWGDVTTGDGPNKVVIDPKPPWFHLAAPFRAFRWLLNLLQGLQKKNIQIPQMVDFPLGKKTRLNIPRITTNHYQSPLTAMNHHSLSTVFLGRHRSPASDAGHHIFRFPALRRLLGVFQGVALGTALLGTLHDILPILLLFLPLPPWDRPMS